MMFENDSKMSRIVNIDICILRQKTAEKTENTKNTKNWKKNIISEIPKN